MAQSPKAESFELFTSLRYDPILIDCPQNDSAVLSFSPKTPLYMLVHHRDRMLEAARHFGWDAVVKKLTDGKSLEKALLSEIETYESRNGGAKTPLKVRVLFSQAGDLKVELGPVPAVSLSVLYPSSLSMHAQAASAKPFKPSPLTGGALSLGPTDSLPSASSQAVPWQLHLDTQPTPSTPYTSLKTTRRAHYESSRARVLPKEPHGSIRHEVILFNTCNEITEGSTTSLYFFRGGQWVTPPVGSTPSGLPDVEGKVEISADGSAPVGVPGAPQERRHEDPDDGEGDRLPSFPGRWGHSLRSSTKWPDSGGQRGTTRRWALRAGLCMEEIVDKVSVTVGEMVWVSNGVRGFHIGEVVG